MNDHQLKQSIDRVVQRVEWLDEQIRSENDPGISVVPELLSAREIFVGILEKQPDFEDCQKQIDQIDELMHLREERWGVSSQKAEHE
ncbi:MAG: hypothetical protein KAT79_03405 [candidate division Zixibacteria bacterium]|nr:hypothetical protein [candidate division Zixibacteria bacterium]